MGAPFRLADPNDVPVHVLFPDDYEASKRMIVRDFALIGVTLVGGVVLAALLNLALA